jgi:tetratricopeptide (TPR) repeat protein
VIDRPDPLPEALLLQLRGTYAELQRRLDQPLSSEEREQVKQEIIALFRRVDGALAELAGLKEEIRELVARYKAAMAAATPVAAPPPQLSSEPPAVHADHLGASTYIEKGWSLISLGEHVAAITALHRALELAPGDTQAQSLLGWAQMLHEDFDDALATFSKVLAREPANALARINVGYICLKKRIFGEAIEHLSRAIRLDNDRKATLYAHFYLGLVYLEREMYEDAQSFFRKTLLIGPNLVEARYELGRAQWFAGDRDGALASWTEGRDANRFNPWSKRCAEVLDLVAAGGDIPRSSSAS